MPKGKTVLVAVLIVSLAYVGYRGLADTLAIWNNQETDFRTFYQAGGLVVSGHRDLLYGGKGVRSLPERFIHAPGNFFDPPLFAVLYAPLSVLNQDGAHALYVGILAVCTVALVLLCRRWSRANSDAVLLAVAIAGFWPLYNSIQVGQPAIIFALIAAMGFAYLEAGHEGRAGAVLSIMVLKPSLALAHGGLALFRGNRATWGWFVAGCVVLGAVPFLWTGLGSVDSFRNLLSASREDAFTILGGITAGAFYMFNWNGFWARLTFENPSAEVMFPLYLLTVALMVKVWAQERLLESWLAAALATNLAIPHLIYYDTLLLLPPAFAVAATRRQAPLLALMALTHVAINVSMWQIYRNGFEFGTRQGYALILATPAMFLLLAYLAFEPEIRRLRRRERAEAAAV